MYRFFWLAILLACIMAMVWICWPKSIEVGTLLHNQGWFDGRKVAVRGTIENAMVGEPKNGTANIYMFMMSDASGSIQVLSLKDFKYGDGDRVIVKGNYYLDRDINGIPFNNVLDASDGTITGDASYYNSQKGSFLALVLLIFIGIIAIKKLREGSKEIWQS